MSLFIHFVWMRHHVYGHHSFTGDVKLDPDMKHGRPFIKKWEGDSKIFKWMETY